METKDLIQKVNEGLTALNSEMASVKASQAKGAEFEAKLTKITDDVTKAAEQLQEIKTKNDAIEVMLNRVNLAGEKKNETPEKIVESKAALKAYLLEGATALRDTKFKATPDGLEIRGMATDNNPSGGYLVIPEIADFLVTRLFETSPLRSLARVINTQSKSMQVVIDDNESEARWVGEGASGGETNTPDVGLLEITAHKIEAEPRITVEMLQDPFMDVEAWLGGKVSDKFARTENTAFVVGDSVGKPQGFLSLPNWASAGVYQRGRIEQIALGGASDVTADGLINLQASLKEVYQGNATWLVKRQSYGNILRQKGADNYFFSTTLLRDGQQTLQLLGKPVVFADDVPAIGAGSLAVAYGDFSVGYTILDRVGLNVLSDPYTAKGFVKYYATKRTGGAVTNYEAIKIGRISAS